MLFRAILGRFGPFCIWKQELAAAKRANLWAGDAGRPICVLAFPGPLWAVLGRLGGLTPSPPPWIPDQVRNDGLPPTGCLRRVAPYDGSIPYVAANQRAQSGDRSASGLGGGSSRVRSRSYFVSQTQGSRSCTMRRASGTSPDSRTLSR